MYNITAKNWTMSELVVPSCQTIKFYYLKCQPNDLTVFQEFVTKTVLKHVETALKLSWSYW